ncbi:putative DNA polymerase I [Selenomonas ruminantium subsp. lactilytica TAM6421]|uniref:DNA polymerase I n=1 Tax=Selenomonas ruminantium subsp. lactilytica (strain NBRC 103574 / TAM6421) TaxID=927704 RepID=I0GR26_SELRL|nr:DNA polymerase I [Selenomonas ruminantium]BAL83213.1 putative DNA polymerase I [Selenomonas ruminantium subsp. lactilytica TAM6421]
MNQRFVILDGSSLMYRAFYALPDLTDSQGHHTNAIFGFSNMLTKLLSELKPDKLVIAFDKGRKTFRTERYADYKGTRDKTPEELLAQIPLLHEFAAAFGISFIEKERYEADDIIGTLATKAAGAGHDVLVVTGDKDALQLVRPNLKVLLTKKGITNIKEYDEAAFEEEYGFEPIKLIDYKGLMGDTSDNIPGVPNVGPKTAGKLLIAYGSLEGVYEHIDEVSGKKLKENLVNNQEQAVLSKELATIECNVPDMELAWDSYDITPDHEKMRAFCDAYELKAVWKNFTKLYGEGDDNPVLEFFMPEAVAADLHYTRLQGQDLQRELTAADSLAVSGIFAQEKPFARVKALLICTLPAQNMILVDADEDLALAKEICAQKDMTVYNLKAYYQAGFTPADRYFDVELAAYLLNPEASKYELERLAAEYLPQEVKPAAFADEYEEAAWQAHVLARLQPILNAKLGELQLDKLYREIELPLVEVLAAIEQNGIYINRDELDKKGRELESRLESLQADIHLLAGMEFNINSPKQLGEVLFERLELPPVKKTKTGYSTNAEVLEALRDKHPIVEQVLHFRTLSKLKSTYIDGLRDLIGKEGRIYTTFNQTVTATGRLSSSDPNLQNIPVRTEEGKAIRALFEPGDGYDCLLSADYSQIELRILAHASQDERFMDAFRQNQDIHARTASEVFNVPLDEVTSQQRSHAKAVNFGIVYGISDFGLAKDLHIAKKDAKQYIDNYFARYTGVKKFIDDTVEKAHADGYVTTIFGRRRDLPAINSRNFMQRSLAERMAMNTPIQGAAADIIKLAMIAVYHKLKEADVKSRILVQVHDELVLEVIDSEREQVEKILKEAMEQVTELSVPLLIDIHAGKNWAEAK